MFIRHDWNMLDFFMWRGAERLFVPLDLLSAFHTHTHTGAHTQLPTKRHKGRCNYAPILGLIIDAFGELRDQQEQVKEDMEVRRDADALTLPHRRFQRHEGSRQNR